MGGYCTRTDLRESEITKTTAAERRQLINNEQAGEALCGMDKSLAKIREVERVVIRLAPFLVRITDIHHWYVVR